MTNAITSEALLMQMRAMASAAQAKNTESVAEVSSAGEFSELLKQSIDKVNETQMEAKKITEAFQRGDPDVQMSEMMVAMQKSSVSFQAMLQVRNKLVSAYQEIMNMPV